MHVRTFLGFSFKINTTFPSPNTPRNHGPHITTALFTDRPIISRLSKYRRAAGGRRPSARCVSPGPLTHMTRLWPACASREGRAERGREGRGGAARGEARLPTAHRHLCLHRDPHTARVGAGSAGKAGAPRSPEPHRRVESQERERSAADSRDAQC